MDAAALVNYLLCLFGCHCEHAQLQIMYKLFHLFINRMIFSDLYAAMCIYAAGLEPLNEFIKKHQVTCEPIISAHSMSHEGKATIGSEALRV